MSDDSLATVSIRPGVGILGVLRHLKYQPWYAIAEFVDNALQSFIDNREQLERLEGSGFKLRVCIELDASDGGRIVVRDNAAGIHAADFDRAFRPAEPPPDRSGMAEFGMGMKSAACWYAREWSVRTSALGEPVARTVHFEVDTIIRERIEQLAVRPEPAAARDHYTEILLTRLNSVPRTTTVSKIKQHLKDIYRIFLRSGQLVIEVKGEQLEFNEVKVLRAPFYKDPSSEPLVWRKDLDLNFGLGLRAHGFAALRERASVSEAGFALFRRGRLIQGSADEGYRPEAVFGKSNSYRYQRLFGELHLDGFEVSYTKDGFRWDENEEIFLECLREELDRQPLPLLQQAEQHRIKQKAADLKPAAEEAAKRTAEVIQREVPPVLEQQLQAPPEQHEPPADLPRVTQILAQREIAVEIRGVRWQITIDLSTDPAIGEWLSVSEEHPRQPGEPRRLGLRLALAHPFMERFGGTDPETIEPLLRVAAALGLAETSARAAGVKKAGTIRHNMNEFLRDALSKP